MIAGDSEKIKGHLLNGNIKIPIEAAYATKYSLSLRFLNGYNLSQGFEFEKMVFNIEKEEIEIGPCRFISESNEKPYKGYLIFQKNIYDFYSLFFKKRLETLQNEFSNLPLVLKHKKGINSEFKEYTANLVYDLNSYKRKFDRLDMQISEEPENIINHVQEAILSTEGRKFMDFLDEKLQEFEYIVADFSKKEHKQHGFYLRNQLWNIILCSPFMARTNLRPRGYSGDSVMMKMLYLNQYEGNSTFGKIMHKHPVEHPAAQAVRNRLEIITNLLKKLELKKNGRINRKIRILSVACGPAFEISSLINNYENCNKFSFVLLDQDKKALSEARKLISKIEEKLGVKIEVDYLNKSVRSMLSEQDIEKRWGKFDFIYSMGLFDYLTRPIAKSVINQLYKILENNGKMVIGNFHVSNPSKYYMEYWLDWILNYRTEQEFIELMEGNPSADVNIFFEDTGSQMFLNIKN